MLLEGGTVRRWVTAAAVSAIVTIPNVAAAQAVVRTIVLGDQPVSETYQVHLSRFAELTEETRIAVDTSLDVGDLFWAVTPDSGVALELGCGSSAATVFRFSGPFRVVVLPPRPDVPCVLQLLSGGVDVRADEATEINAGGIVLGSKGTQYAVRLRREANEPVCDGFVYEDDVEVTTAHAQRLPVTQRTAWTYNFARQASRKSDIPQAMIAESALIATRFDMAHFQPRVDVTNPPEDQRLQARQQLLALHTAALQAPADAETRARLGTTQQRLGIADSARYNLVRAQRIRLDPARSKVEPAKPPESEPPAAQVPPASRDSAIVKTRPNAPSAVRSVERATVLDPSARAMALVRAGNPADAIALLQPRVDAEQATTRDFYALAEAYAATGDRSAAARAAARALGAPDARGALTPAEIERLQSLSGRRYR